MHEAVNKNDKRWHLLIRLIILKVKFKKPHQESNIPLPVKR